MKAILLKVRKKFTKVFMLMGALAFFSSSELNAQSQLIKSDILGAHISYTELLTKNGFMAGQCEGQLIIKDGHLEDIKNLKFNIPHAILKSIDKDSILFDKNVSFEQNRVMVLPLMGMIHLIGELNIDGVKTMADFQLSYTINEDKSISLKGSKLIKSIELKAFNPESLDLTKVKDDLKLDVDFKINSQMGTMLAKN